MKRYTSLSSVLLAGLLSVAVYAGDGEQLSEQGLYRAAFTSEPQLIELNQMHVWVLHVETAVGVAVADAEIRVHGGMPAHHHGLPTEPQVTAYLGDGNYRVEGMKFQMRGRWTVTFEIRAAGQHDNVTFTLDL